MLGGVPSDPGSANVVPGGAEMCFVGTAAGTGAVVVIGAWVAGVEPDPWVAEDAAW